MTNWAVGMRCVCVEEVRSAGVLPFVPAVKNSVYTVRLVDVCTVSDQVILLLEELDNSHLVGLEVLFQGVWHRIGCETGYPSSAFRPLAETRLDQFRQWLVPAPRETEDA